MRIALALALVATSFAPFAARADDPTQAPAPGPWHYRAITCVDTKIVSVEPRLESNNAKPTMDDFTQSGVQVTYATTLGLAPLFANERAEVVHYSGDTSNKIMIAEHKGQTVQVCFLGGPEPTHFCNPDKDDRGRQYRVYDYAQKAQYSGMNSEHDCGGA